MFKKILNIQGFTLVEVLVGMGVMAIGALGVMHMAKIQSDMQRRSKEVIGSSQVINSLQRHLSKARACENTFGGMPASEDFSDGTQVPELRSVNNDILAAVTNPPSPLYPGDATRRGSVDSVTIVDVLIADRAFQDSGLGEYETRTYSFYLDVVLNRRADNLATGNPPNNRTYRLPFPIKIRKAGPNTSQPGVHRGCITEGLTSVEAARFETCLALGGAYDASLQRCVFDSSTNPYVLTSVQYVRERFNSLLETGAYLKRNGNSTFTGLLTMNNALVKRSGTASTTALLAGDVNGETLGGIRCGGANQMGFIVANTISCTDLTCPDVTGLPQYLKGIDNNGNAICNPLVIEGPTCPTGGQLMVDSTTGQIKYECAGSTCTPDCSGAGSVCSGSTYSDGCTGTCTGSFTPPATECSSLRAGKCTTTFAGYDSCGNSCGNGDTVCAPPPPPSSSYEWCGKDLPGSNACFCHELTPDSTQFHPDSTCLTESNVLPSQSKPTSCNGGCTY